MSVVSTADLLVARAANFAHIGGWELDLVTHTLRWSECVYHIHELSPDARVTPAQAVNFYIPAHQPILRAALKCAAADGSPFDLELEIITAKANHAWVRIIGYAYYAGNRVVLLAGALQEINKRQCEEKSALRRERDFSAALFSSAGTLMLALNRSGHIVRFNKTAERITGYRFDEVRECPFWDYFLVPEEKGGVRAVFDSITAGNVVARYENHWRMRDGTQRMFDWSNTVLCDSAGQVEFIVSVGFDITERKAAEQRLREATQLLDSVVENIPNMIFMKRAQDLRFVLINKAGEELLGVSRDDLLGKNDYDIFPEYQADFFTEKDRAVLARLDVEDIPEEPIETRTHGRRILHTRKIALRDEHGVPSYLLGISDDITERKRTEQLKDEFVSIVSHELRTPLTSLRGSLSLLGGQVFGALPVQAQSLIDIAHKNAERLAELIDDILDFEKIGAGKLVFDLKVQPLMPLVEQAVLINAGYADRYSVVFRIVKSIVSGNVKVDAIRLQQVMANLLSNAAKFSPPGAQVDILVQHAGATLSVHVVDRGPGIPESFHARVFEKFSQADGSASRAQGGTGLGLAIAQSMIEGMGGCIGFESRVGQGSRFFIELSAV